MLVVNFPVYFHYIFEWLGFFIGFKLFMMARKDDILPANQRNSVLVASVLGAVIGTKLFVWLENPLQLNVYDVMFSGKSIVGALLGEWMAVEITEEFAGINRSTGDITVIPLIAGMVIGRIGCFLTGLQDKTYGIPTTLPWGVDFGDGISRHPTQLYEIVFLLALLWLIHSLRSKQIVEGMPFKIFMLGYITFKFFVQFLKPTPHIYWGLDFIQLMSLPVVFYCGIVLFQSASKQ